MTIEETKVSIEKDSQPIFGSFLAEKAFLWKLIRKEKKNRTSFSLRTNLMYSTAIEFS